MLAASAALLSLPVVGAELRFATGSVSLWSPEVTLLNGDGAVRGKVGRSNKSVFHGIPFAAPPVGDLRWRLPQRNAPWAPKILDATEFAPNCLQPPDGWNSIKGTSSEDCLYLDVYSPDLVPADALPVLLWIHGGDFTYGGIHDHENDNPRLAESSVVVVINYRLSIFGFLGGEMLRDRTPDRSTGNFGTRDQRAAMVWAQENIAAFGGDPGSLTIFGESAGAGSVTVHLAARPSWGLYQRALCESGAFAQWAAKPMAHAEDNFNFLLQTVNCSSVDCLMAIDADDLLVYQYEHYSSIPWPDTLVRGQFAPVVDGVELTEDPFVLVKRGEVAPAVEVLFGTNLDEGTMFISNDTFTRHRGKYSTAYLPRTIGAPQYAEWAMGTAGQVVGRMLPSIYTLNKTDGDRSFYWAASHAGGDYAISCASQQATQSFRDAGHTAYAYSFRHTPIFSVNERNTEKWGAFHGSEVPFVWGDEFELTGPAETELSKEMAMYWNHFAATGSPSIEGLAEWPEFGQQNMTMVLNTAKWPNFQDVDVKAEANYRGRFCDFWETVSNSVVNPLPAAEFGRHVPQVKLPHVQGSWNLRTPMPTARFDFAVAAVEDRIIAMGGIIWSGEALVDIATVELYDPSSDSWSSVSPMSRARSGLQAATVGDSVYCVGGLIGNGVEWPTFLGLVEAYDLRSQKWSVRSPLPEPRSHFGLAAIDNQLYVAGGTGHGPGASAQQTQSMWRYDVNVDSWQAFAQMPTWRSGLSLVPQGASLHAIGGFTGFVGSGYSADPVSTVEVYWPGNDTWSAGPTLPVRRHSAGAAVAPDGRLFTAGGYSVNDSAMVHVLDGDRWFLGPDMPSARFGLQTAFVGGAVFAIGGTSLMDASGTVLGTVEAWQVADEVFVA